MKIMAYAVFVMCLWWMLMSNVVIASAPSYEINGPAVLTLDSTATFCLTLKSIHNTDGQLDVKLIGQPSNNILHQVEGQAFQGAYKCFSLSVPVTDDTTATMFVDGHFGHRLFIIKSNITFPIKKTDLSVSIVTIPKIIPSDAQQMNLTVCAKFNRKTRAPVALKLNVTRTSSNVVINHTSLTVLTKDLPKMTNECYSLNVTRAQLELDNKTLGHLNVLNISADVTEQGKNVIVSVFHRVIIKSPKTPYLKPGTAYSCQIIESTSKETEERFKVEIQTRHESNKTLEEEEEEEELNGVVEHDNDMPVYCSDDTISTLKNKTASLQLSKDQLETKLKSMELLIKSEIQNTRNDLGKQLSEISNELSNRLNGSDSKVESLEIKLKSTELLLNSEIKKTEDELGQQLIKITNELLGILNASDSKLETKLKSTELLINSEIKKTENDSRKQLTEISNELNAKDSSMEAKIKLIESKLKTSDNRFDSLEGKMKSMENKLEASEKKTNLLEKAKTEMELKIAYAEMKHIRLCTDEMDFNSPGLNQYCSHVFTWKITDVKRKLERSSYEIESPTFDVSGYEFKAKVKLQIKNNQVFLFLTFVREDYEGYVVKNDIDPKVTYIVRDTTSADEDKKHIIQTDNQLHAHSLFYEKYAYERNMGSKSRFSKTSSPYVIDDSLVIDIYVEPPNMAAQWRSNDGVLLGEITNYKRKKAMEVDGLVSYYQSPYFYTSSSSSGYRVQVEVRLNGFGGWNGEGISAAIVILDGKNSPWHDDEISKYRATFTLYNQRDSTKDIVRTYEGQDVVHFFNLVYHSELETGGFILNDALVYRIVMKEL